MEYIFYVICIFTCIAIVVIITNIAIDFYVKRGKNKISMKLIISLFVVAYIAGITLTYFIANYISNSENSSLESPGLLGDSAGAINAFFSAIILAGAIYTLHIQRQNNNADKFERQYYEMLRLHRLNLDQIKFEEAESREAIQKLFYILQNIYYEVEKRVQLIQSLPKDEKYKIEEIQHYLSDEDKKLKVIHEISYGYFFYGFDYILTKDQTDIRHHLNTLITSLIRDYKPLHQISVNSLLGHYYRHLFQTVKFISENTEIEEDTKYHYAKLLRAQLSDFEQALLYYNSLSIMGKNWIIPRSQKVVDEMCPIARYRLIKNTPCYINYFGINPRDFFRTEIQAWKDKGHDFFELNIEAPQQKQSISS